jgi:hypothetical protein
MICKLTGNCIGASGLRHSYLPPIHPPVPNKGDTAWMLTSTAFVL